MTNYSVFSWSRVMFSGSLSECQEWVSMRTHGTLNSGPYYVHETGYPLEIGRRYIKSEMGNFILYD